MISRPLMKALSANANTSAFTAKVATKTKPANDGVLDLGSGGVLVPCRMRLLPYGLGADGDVFSMRVWAWHRLPAVGALEDLWVPSALGEFSCTLSTAVGVAGTPVLDTERFADTISIVATVGEATITADTTRQGTVELFSPANNTPGWVEMSTRGATLLEFDFDQTTNTPTCNCLVLFQ